MIYCDTKISTLQQKILLVVVDADSGRH